MNEGIPIIQEPPSQQTSKKLRASKGISGLTTNPRDQVEEGSNEVLEQLENHADEEVDAVNEAAGEVQDAAEGAVDAADDAVENAEEEAKGLWGNT